MTEGKPSRQSNHEANLRKAGWRRVGVWFSPEDLARLSGIAVGAGSEQEAVRRAVRLASDNQLDQLARDLAKEVLDKIRNLPSIYLTTLDKTP